LMSLSMVSPLANDSLEIRSSVYISMQWICRCHQRDL
jgi:hypothetical protein